MFGDLAIYIYKHRLAHGLAVPLIHSFIFLFFQLLMIQIIFNLKITYTSTPSAMLLDVNVYVFSSGLAKSCLSADECTTLWLGYVVFRLLCYTFAWNIPPNRLFSRSTTFLPNESILRVLKMTSLERSARLSRNRLFNLSGTCTQHLCTR